MASRSIAITITLENRDAISNIKAQTVATQALSEVTDKHTQLQNGLTNSFLKGNLAARAISFTYIEVRDALQALIKSSVEFEYNMATLNQITNSGPLVSGFLEQAIRSTALATNQSVVETSKAAIALSKLSLSASQIADALPAVTELSKVMGVDVADAGKAVVQVIHSFGLTMADAGLIADKLTYSMTASGLSAVQFENAFQYTGALAKSSGVGIDELAGAMDTLAINGAKPQKIGTSLRAIILDLGDANSKASKALGGTIESVGGLAKAMEILGQKSLGAPDNARLFGKVAAENALILEKNSAQLEYFTKNTENAMGINKRMTDALNDTTKGALAGVASAWENLGIAIGKSSGNLKDFLVGIKAILEKLAQFINPQGASIDDFKKNHPAEFAAAMKDAQPLQGSAWAKSLLGWGGSQQGASLDIKNTPEYDKYLMEYWQKRSLDLAADAVKQAPQSGMGLSPDTGAGSKKGGSGLLDALDFASPWDQLGQLGKNGKTGFEEFSDKLASKEIKEQSVDAKQAAKDLIAFDAATDKMIKNQKEAAAYLAKTDLELLYLKIGAEAVDGSVQIFGNHLAAAFVGKSNPFKGITDEFDNFAQQMIANLIELTARLLIFRAVLAVITGQPFSIGGGFGFSTSGLSGLQTGFLEILHGNASKNASGTDQIVRQPTLMMMGESGPERLRVTPSSRMGRDGNSGGATFIIQGDVYDYNSFSRKVKAAQDKNGRSYV